jgi:hypothetical protein
MIAIAKILQRNFPKGSLGRRLPLTPILFAFESAMVLASSCSKACADHGFEKLARFVAQNTLS